MYNNRRVVPAFAVGGPFSQDIIITAGANQDGTLTGYSSGSLLPAFGSISGAPVEGHPVIVAATFMSGDLTAIQVIIQGDVVDLLDGKTVWVDGVPYTSMNPGNGWIYQEATGGTAWNAILPYMFEVGSQYKIEVKEPAL